jgi:hypothetical protein
VEPIKVAKPVEEDSDDDDGDVQMFIERQSANVED